MDVYAPAKRYVQTMYEIETHLWIWRSLIEKSVLEFEKEPDWNYELFSSIFCVYNLDNISNNGLLKTYFGESKSIKINSLKTQQVVFFRWVMNLSILRAYNAIEIFISSAILEEYMGKEITSSQFKELSTKLNVEIKISIAL